MNWLGKMNEALQYIEDNLTGEIKVEEAAKIALCSSFNFQRMFSYMADVSLGDYIRRRRMTMAATELLTEDTRVIDVAVKYGYESPVSFARAFHAMHGMNPSEVKKPGAKIKSYSRISFEITIKGVEAMNYYVKELEGFRVIGYKERVPLTGGENFKRVLDMWDRLSEDGRYDELLGFNDKEELACLGVCANCSDDEFDYYIATGSDQPLKEGMVELAIPPATYVIFECVGKLPESQQTVWKRIFTEFFPTSGYEIMDGPQIEWYSMGDPSKEDYVSQIWIPVGKKA
uniref:AraC family transcriptional regulator n=1 Tax=Clostridium sp. 12(A) TaxID=1163671 RepID=UPI00046729E8|nr:AraC family transcriptional regulator [Clostridium sp. 12(A)]